LAEPLSERLHGEGEEEKPAAKLASRVLLRCKLASLSPDELSELSRDLQEQMIVRGQGAAQASLPKKDLGGILAEVQRESKRQTLAGLGGGAAGGLAGGASGALIAALTKGREHALSGALMGVLPGSVGGYLLGKRLQQQRELADRLREKL
jgi:hypothetical protein